MQKTVLAFGETLWDLLPSGPQLGGAPCNFAYRVKELGDQAVLATRMGRDPLGEEAFRRLKELGMNMSQVQWDRHRPTGTVPIKVDERGVPDFTIVPDVAYDEIEATEGLLEVAGQAHAVCFGTLVQRAPISRRTLDRVLEAAGGALKVLDLNLRKECYTPEVVAASVARADVLKLNDEEARELAGACDVRERSLRKIGEALVRRGRLSLCLITLGDRGALAVSRDAGATYDPGYRVEVVDTVGSGDAFTAGFLHEHLRGRPLADCVRVGNALAAVVAGQAGATAPVSRAELEAMLGSDRERIGEPTLKELD